MENMYRAMIIFWLTCLVGYPRTSATEPETLKKEKESLQRDKRNLKGRLSTAQSNNAKYRSVLKKEKPNVGLDKETFERMMNLLDDIITPV